MSYRNPLRARFPEAFFRSLPAVPGVYFMRSRGGEVLYVGKAKCLRSRVSSYRSARPGRAAEHVIEMLDRVRSIEWEEHASETRALERERELIRALVPPFNRADAWQEEYLFIGLRQPGPDRLEFRLTSRQGDAADFELHGCYAHRGRTKGAYSALLRLLYATAHDRPRFSFPARITRGSPAYSFGLRMPDAGAWVPLISAFLRGADRALLERIVEALLANERIPPFARFGLQEDLEALQAFQQGFRERAPRGLRRGPVSHERMRRHIRRSVRRAD